MKEIQKQYKSNGNYTAILYSHELFTGYFTKFFNPSPLHLIIKRKEPHEGSSFLFTFNLTGCLARCDLGTV